MDNNGLTVFSAFDGILFGIDSENLIHARNNGLLKTKINNEIAEQIKNENGTIREIAKKYGIGKTQVGYIKQGKRWKK